MNELVLSYDAITTHHGEPATTSLAVAKYFRKNHQHILRDISHLAEPESGLSKEFSVSNFGRAEYLDAQKKPRPMYYVTKNGFTLLVMGFTGKEAMRFKEAYIAAFDQMAATLRSAETHFTRKAKAALRDKYPKMEPALKDYQRNHSVPRIATDNELSVGTVRNHLKRCLHWGLITEEEYKRAKRLNREFQQALKLILKERQLPLEL